MSRNRNLLDRTPNSHFLNYGLKNHFCFYRFCCDRQKTKCTSRCRIYRRSFMKNTSLLKSPVFRREIGERKYFVSKSIFEFLRAKIKMRHNAKRAFFHSRRNPVWHSILRVLCGCCVRRENGAIFKNSFHPKPPSSPLISFFPLLLLAFPLHFAQQNFPFFQIHHALQTTTRSRGR
jgi:hypothetical protein